MWLAGNAIGALWVAATHCARHRNASRLQTCKKVFRSCRSPGTCICRVIQVEGSAAASFTGVGTEQNGEQYPPRIGTGAVLVVAVTCIKPGEIDFVRQQVMHRMLEAARQQQLFQIPLPETSGSCRSLCSGPWRLPDFNFRLEPCYSRWFTSRCGHEYYFSTASLGTMSFNAVLDLFATCLGFFSALFFCVGILHFDLDRAEEIATKMWEADLAVSEEMVLQKADFVAGACLLLLSFMVQVMLKLSPSSTFSSDLTDEWWNGAAISLAGATSFAFFVRIASLRLGKVFLQRLRARTEGKL